MMIFVDTGAWYALVVRRDPNFPRLKRWLETNSEPLLTTDYCVDETLTLLAARGRIDLSVQTGKAFFDEHLAKLHYLTSDQIQRAWILFQQRAEAGWSFTDCTSKIVIDDLGIRTAVALDEHFRQFGINVVPQ